MPPPGRNDASADPDGPLPDLIVQPYLLVLFSVPFYIDAAGRRWIDALWAKDLVEHARYIRDLSFATQLIHSAPPPNSLALDEIPELKAVRRVELPAARNTLAALALLPRTCGMLWRELKRAEIVHTAVAGWPLAEAWLLVPMLWFRRRLLYINVESAFWRTVAGQKAGLKTRLRAAFSESANRWCIQRSDISTFTHDGYRRSLLTRRTERGHVMEASWIDEATLLSDQQLERALEERRRTLPTLRMVFAGRLTEAKGTLLLLQATAACVRAGVDVQLDVFGEGPLEAELSRRIAADGMGARIRMRGTLPYDRRFFDALAMFDVIVIPTLSDEQPRIVFDAFSQGLPVIASRTEGAVQCIEDGVTGLLFETGDAAAFEARITQVAGDPDRLPAMARACLAYARRKTHQHMHRARWRLLATRFPSLTRQA
jgi:glycosyltransferase involved in cell wall biosynthesis